MGASLGGPSVGLPVPPGVGGAVGSPLWELLGTLPLGAGEGLAVWVGGLLEQATTKTTRTAADNLRTFPSVDGFCRAM